MLVPDSKAGGHPLARVSGALARWWARLFDCFSSRRFLREDRPPYLRHLDASNPATWLMAPAAGVGGGTAASDGRKVHPI